jgi:hypothetical protein
MMEDGGAKVGRWMEMSKLRVQEGANASWSKSHPGGLTGPSEMRRNPDEPVCKSGCKSLL